MLRLFPRIEFPIRSSRRYLTTPSDPKPFPSPYNIGIDIASVPRFEKLLLESKSGPQVAGNLTPKLQAFLRRVFNAYEWPHMISLLRLGFNTPGRDHITGVARWIAGRWAAKEAAIKAHSNRRLTYRDVIIEAVPDAGPRVLINPPNRQHVVLDRQVAIKRGLLGVSDNKESLQTYKRLIKVDPRDRQIAQVSISHDGDYAIATVLALDEPVFNAEIDPIIDDGIGKPLHEPLIGDAGYKEYNPLTAELVTYEASQPVTKDSPVDAQESTTAVAGLDKKITARHDWVPNRGTPDGKSFKRIELEISAIGNSFGRPKL